MCKVYLLVLKYILKSTYFSLFLCAVLTTSLMMSALLHVTVLQLHSSCRCERVSLETPCRSSGQFNVTASVQIISNILVQKLLQVSASLPAAAAAAECVCVFAFPLVCV